MLPKGRIFRLGRFQIIIRASIVLQELSHLGPDVLLEGNLLAGLHQLGGNTVLDAGNDTGDGILGSVWVHILGSANGLDGPALTF